MERPTPAAENTIDELVSALRTTLPPDTHHQSASASPMALPSNYSGEAVECNGFLYQVSLHYIEMHSHKFTNERSKVAFLISLLTGRALIWAQAIWNSQSNLIDSFEDFSSHFQEVFGLATGSLSVSDQLILLRQGSSSASDYTLQFWTLAATCGWNETALLIAYRQGLNPQLRAQMAIYENSVELESFMQKAVKISQHLTPCLPETTAHSPSSPTACPPVPEPMQMDSSHLSPPEHAHRLTTGLCLYCGAPGHFISACPSRPPRPAVSTHQLEPDISNLTLLDIQLLSPLHIISARALVDSGSSGNFISPTLLKQLGLPPSETKRT